jgi:hypothetical protein
MTSDELPGARGAANAAKLGAAQDMELLRRYEPVLRFTQGEVFLPMPVEDYLGECSLWRAGPGRRATAACLPGGYLVTVEPPALARVLAGLRRLSRLLLPWTAAHSGTAFGLPFIDYHRGDGPGVGPGEARSWRPVLVHDETPWLRDSRGLWGLDTHDPFGRERAPAGPRYERDGSVRLCWSDPVGWAGLDKQAATPFVTGLAFAAVIAGAAWLAVRAALGHWRSALAVLLFLAAGAMLLVSLRDFFTKR